MSEKLEMYSYLNYKVNTQAEFTPNVSSDLVCSNQFLNISILSQLLINLLILFGVILINFS